MVVLKKMFITFSLSAVNGIVFLRNKIKLNATQNLFRVLMQWNQDEGINL